MSSVLEKPKINITKLFETAKSKGLYLKVSAPMVRYSKLEFRTLVRKYNVDLCFTPMIIANSFCQSSKARLIEYTTSTNDCPLIVQFAANKVNDYLSAAEMIYPYSDGIDLNCGCPQRWAIQSGYGSKLLKNPQLVKDLTLSIRQNLPIDFSVSVKIRLKETIRATINLCQQLEKCGITFITVHGRTVNQKNCESINVDALREIKQSVQIPLIANGNIYNLDQANELRNGTGCDGIMSARGILANPALFANYKVTPFECIQEWLNIVHESGNNISYQTMHHHITFMMEKIMDRDTKINFNNLKSKDDVYNFLKTKYQLVPESMIDYDPVQSGINRIACEFLEENYRERVRYQIFNTQNIQQNNQYSSEEVPGKYFLDTVKSNLTCDLDFMESSLFNVL